MGLEKIIEAILVAVLVGIGVEVLIHYLFERRKKRTHKTIFDNSINKADKLLKNNLPQEALTIYNDLLKSVSHKEYPEIYGIIKNSEGECYLAFANLRDKGENLAKAIHAFEEH